MDHGTHDPRADDPRLEPSEAHQECASSKSRRESKQCCRSQKIQVIGEPIPAEVQRDAQPECIGAEATENQAFEGGTADHNPVEKPSRRNISVAQSAAIV